MERVELALLQLEIEVVFSQLLEDLRHVLAMFGQVTGVDQNIVNVDDDEALRWPVGVIMYLNEVVGASQVQLGEDASPTELFQGGRDQRKRIAEFDGLRSFQSLSAPPESTDVNDNPFSSLSSFDGVRESVHQLRDRLEDFCKEKKISDRVTLSNIVPRTRNDFLQYSHQLTLDLNTVNKHLRLSERNRVITDTYPEFQSYPDHPDRFDHFAQVLCRESVCGRCYWEIEWSGGRVYISVSYKSISRKGSGNESFFGSNDQSWSLFCSFSGYSIRHNNIHNKLRVKPISSRTGVCVDHSRTGVCVDHSRTGVCVCNRRTGVCVCYSRIGVCVDHSAGTLSFYSVSDTMSLIHTVQTTFTQPLYPGFMVYYGSSVKLC
ncbi:tripartite motif-containing protein 16-like protein [Rhinichthys klamathensis goyatoka]|uniref:tripartite motif-containing protein 16-like protein n=1 Tax=Rhinichthys klamathensis goyatoka TaxID=3034132 RepID=UPI0024B5735B|nr:tripartite motif-containing protein 16-like protein [Rhinichthys klamathensis goyatoka]